MLGGLGGGWVGCFVHVGPIRGCLVVVLGVGRGGWAVFWWFFVTWWVFRVREKVVKLAFLPCRWVFSFTSFTGLYMHGCNGRVRARCVCYLLVKVVKLVKLICGLTWENPSFTRAKSCEAVVKLVKPGVYQMSPSLSCRPPYSRGPLLICGGASRPTSTPCTFNWEASALPSTGFNPSSAHHTR